MELKGERRLPADQSAAWAALTDIAVLRQCIPGCETLAALDDNRYEIVMTAAVGPVKSRFKGTLELADIDAPNAYTLKFDGTGGAAGFARGQAAVRLVPLGARETRLDYAAQAQVGGRLAQVGSRLIDAAAGATADRFFETFSARLTEQMAAATPVGGASLWALLKAYVKRLLGRRSR